MKDHTKFWGIEELARELGVTRKTLWKKIREQPTLTHRLTKLGHRKNKKYFTPAQADAIFRAFL